jgi:hypothetical protein
MAGAQGTAGIGAGGIAGGGATGAGGVGGSGCKTSVSGTVYDPAGTTPIYRAHVYWPSTALDAVPEGISCTACGTPESGRPITDTVTDTSGQFKLVGVPAGANIPLVIQVGKWRRQIAVPTVAACGDTPLAATTTRLPRDSTEGHLPHIAVVTGHASALECWLRNVGISDGEFSSETGSGRVHLYAGGAGNLPDEGADQLSFGEMFTDAYASLFVSPTKLAGYDMVLLGCEGEQLASQKDPHTATLKAYADAGGRILAEHFQSYWIRRGPPPWPATAMWNSSVAADLPSPLTATLDTSSDEGMAIGSWMLGIGAATNGQLSVTMAQNSLQSVVSPTQQWLTGPPGSEFPLLISFPTPFEATSGPQCGRVDFSDMHTSDEGVSHPDVPFPSGCTTTSVAPQERLLEFLFFDTPTCAP